jgi:hypothetical protein
MRAMAGAPIKRMRKASIADPVTGKIVPFPCMSRVADLPAGWRRFSNAQKIEHLIGMDRFCKILSWPWDGLDPLRCSTEMQVFRIVFPICVNATLDGTLEREIARERDRERRLEELARRLGGKEAPETWPRSGKTGVPARGGPKSGATSETARNFQAIPFARCLVSSNVSGRRHAARP